jgi:hypothetical protein
MWRVANSDGGIIHQASLMKYEEKSQYQLRIEKIEN